MSKERISLFLTAFTQIGLVSANVFFISHSIWIGIILSSYGINYIWTRNVKRACFATEADRHLYAAGACLGCLFGWFMTKNIYQWLN